MARPNPSQAVVLFEFILGGLILLGVICLTVPRFTVSRERAREVEVKANLNAIQTALERYAVDHGGIYPLMLYGGDASDPFTTTTSPQSSEFPGDVDVLLEESYLTAYPGNPFARRMGQRLIFNPERVLDRTRHQAFKSDGAVVPRIQFWSTGGTRGYADRSQQWVPRQVGGPTGSLMWDVSEGQRHAPPPIVVVPDDGWNTREPPGARPPKGDHQSWWTSGNFYYYATFGPPGGNFRSATPPTPVGYELAGYGAWANPGQDVFASTLGDFYEMSLGLGRTSPPCPPPLDCDPDNRRDGIILVLQDQGNFPRERTSAGRPAPRGVR